MTAPLLELPELAERSGVPVERLRRYAEDGLLTPARHDGDRFGYPPAETAVVRMVAEVEDLGVGGEDLTGLAAAWRGDDCSGAHRRLTAAVSSRLATVQYDLNTQLQRATGHGPGTDGWAEATRATVTLTADTARLQAVTAALAATEHTGPCGDGCGCATALTAPGTRYHFPSDPTAAEAGLACDLVADDDGDATERISVWQQVFARVQRRDPLPDTETGVALRFPLEAELAATLARLAAAEYRCCSFGSYTLVIDHAGLRLEVRMPDDAAGMLAAVIGLPDPPAPAAKEVSGAADQP